MLVRYTFVLMLLCSCCGLYAQQRLAFVSYNVENLYDTIPSSRWNDREFLPTSPKGWTTKRMKRKCHQIAEVLSYVSEWEVPAFIALQEVESVEVLDQLAHHTILREARYKIICSTGSDERGSHIALLYDGDRFAVERVEEWPIYITPDSIYPTRNILFVTGRIPSGAPLSLIICHLPSRRGGVMAAEARSAVIDILQMRTDSILRADLECPVLVMGDFNTTPEDGLTDSWARAYTDHSDIAYGMVEVTPPQTPKQWKHMPPGSYYYQGSWERIDRLFVSFSLLLEESDIRVDVASLRFALPPKKYLYETSMPWGRPRRTYGGDSYLGGPSDHLPLVGSLIY